MVVILLCFILVLLRILLSCNIRDELTMEAYNLMKDNGIELANIIVHAPYIVNLANSKNFDFSVSFLINEVERCSMLGCKYLVLHPGSSVGLMKDIAIKNIIDGLNLILNNNYNVTILLETMAGKGSEIGSSFEEINTIITGVKFKDKIGVCLDTCHINDAGYDISNFDNVLNEFNNIIGLNYLKCIHINDSINIKGSHKDRHANLGYGTFGFSKLINVIYNKRLSHVPFILESPYVNRNTKDEYPPYKYEIEMIRKKEFIDFIQ